MPPKRQPKAAPPKSQEPQKVAVVERPKPDAEPSKYRVVTTNRDFDGKMIGCQFKNGVWEGELFPWQLTMFREWGYECTVIANS